MNVSMAGAGGRMTLVARVFGDLPELIARPLRCCRQHDSGSAVGLISEASPTSCAVLRREHRVLRGERDPAEGGGFLRRESDQPRLKLRAIAALRTSAGGRLCEGLGRDRRQGEFDAWRRRVPSRRSRADQRRTELTLAAHGKSRRTYGVPRMHAELRDTGPMSAESGWRGRRRPGHRGRLAAAGRSANSCRPRRRRPRSDLLERALLGRPAARRGRPSITQLAHPRRPALPAAADDCGRDAWLAGRGELYVQADLVVAPRISSLRRDRSAKAARRRRSITAIAAASTRRLPLAPRFATPAWWRAREQRRCL